MKLDILLSTMHMKDADEMNKLNISGNCIVINQCDQDKMEVVKSREGTQQVIVNTRERGLSKSRNMALFLSKADICKLSDDDLKYIEHYDDLITKAFEDYPQADVICFHVKRPERMKPTFSRPVNLNYLTTLKVCSVEIAFRKDRIGGIQFREDFGTGSNQYKMGEENIFLYDCLKRHLKILYLPITIGELLESESTWDTGFHKEFFVSRGANYYAMSRLGSHTLILQYALRKWKAYSKKISFKEAISCMYQGRKELKRKNILLVGDYYSKNGPAKVTNDYIEYLPSSVRIIKSRNKLLRVAEITWKLSQSQRILCSGFSKQNELCFRHGKNFKKPTAYLMHGSVVFENKINQVENLESEQFESRILELADVVLAVSRTYAEWVRENYPQIKDKVMEMSNGINWSDLDYQKKRLLANPQEHLQTSKEYITIMSSGGGMPIKNMKVVCEAIKRIHEQASIPIRFWVYGKEDLDSAQIRTYEFVQDFGLCSHEQVLEAMSKADLYIQNSRFETFGLAPIEAASLGCKIMISKWIGAKDTMMELFDLSDNQIIEDINSIEELTYKIQDNITKVVPPQSIEELSKYKTSVQKRSMELFHYLSHM